MVRYKVTLTLEERAELTKILSAGKHSSHQYRSACILLHVDAGSHSGGQKALTYEQIASVLGIDTKTIERLKKRFVEEGFEACLERKASTAVRTPKIDGDAEAHLIALACSKAPDGYARWSLRMLADKMVALEYVPQISHETVRQVLKKMNLSPGK